MKCQGDIRKVRLAHDFTCSGEIVRSFKTAQHTFHACRHHVETVLGFLRRNSLALVA